MLTISNVRSNHQLNNHSKVNFTSEHNNSNNNSASALNKALIGLAMLGMTACSMDDDHVYEPYKPTAEEIANTPSDSINKARSLDEYMQDLGFLQNGNKLGDVKSMYFEDMNGTKHYMEKGDSVSYGNLQTGIQFHGVDVDKNGNKQEYNIKFEKYHNGLIVTKDSVNPNYKEGGVDSTEYVYSNGRTVTITKPSLPKDTVTYRFSVRPNGKYTVQKAEGKGLIFYTPVAEARKTNEGLLFEGYDWVNERKTDDIQILSNFQNNVAMPKDEE